MRANKHPIACAMRIGIPGLALVVLVGCAGPSTHEKAAEKVRSATDQTELNIEAVHARAVAPLPLVQRVNIPYLAGRSSAVARESALPPVLRKETTVALIFDDGGPANKLGDVEVPLQVFAERLTRATGVPTRVRPDALIAPSGSRGGGSTGGAASAGPTGAAVGGGAQSAGRSSAQSATVSITLPARLVAPVSQMLELISARLGIQSRYTTDGVLEFYRLGTETFLVGVQPEGPAAGGGGGASLGSSGGGSSSGASGGSGGSGGSSTVSAQKAFSSTVDVVRSLLSSAGSVASNEATRQIIVTDSPDVLATVRDSIAEMNRQLTLRIGLYVQVVNCVETRSVSAGVDWSALYTATLAKYGYALNYVSPVSTSSVADGTFLLSSTKGSAASTRWTGSSALLRALAEAGNTCTERTQTFLTTNGKAIAYALTNSFDYVSSTSASQTSGSNTIAIAVNTKTQTVGRTLSALPVSIGEGNVSVDLSIAESSLNSLTQQSTGSGASQQTVQLPDTSAQTSKHTVVLAPNEAIVIAGLEGTSNGTQRRSLGDNISPWLGGNAGANSRTERSFVVVSAQAMEP